MDFDEIMEIGFFHAFMHEYVEFYFNYGNHNRNMLIYDLCNSEEEKRKATFDEIAIIKKKIKKYDHDGLSSVFLKSYKNKKQIPGYEQNNDPAFWENYFSQFIQDIIPGFNWYSILGLKIDKSNENVFPFSELGDSPIHQWIDGKSLNLPFLIKIENEIMEMIKNDIKSYKENGSWDIDLYNYEMYIKHNISMKKLCRFCELLVQLFRLRQFEDHLEIHDNDEFKYIENSFKDKLVEYGFFDLPMIKMIRTENHSKLLGFIKSKGTPYGIAFFDYVGFLKHLEKEHFQTKDKLNKELGKLLNTHHRTIKGHISSLATFSDENKTRYTAYRYKETVENEYNTLK